VVWAFVTFPFNDRHILDAVRGSVRVTMSFTYRYALARMRQGVGAITPLCRYALARMRRGVAAITTPCRYAFSQLRGGVRATMPFAYRCLLDEMRGGVRSTVATYRHALAGGRRGAGALTPPCRYALAELRRGVLATMSFANCCLLDAMRGGVRSTVATYRHALAGGRQGAGAFTLVGRYTFGQLRQGVRTTTSFAYRLLLDEMRGGVRSTVATYRYALVGGGRGAGAFTPVGRYTLGQLRQSVRTTTSFAYRRLLDEMRGGVRSSVATYRYALVGGGRGAGAFTPACGYAPDQLRRGVRATMLLAYPGVLDRVRRGIRATIALYRHVLDGMGRGVQATISFPSLRYAIIGATALAVLAPLSLVLYQSFLSAPFSDLNARLGLQPYQFVFADAQFRAALGATLLLAAGMILIAVPLGAVLAFLMLRTDVPGRRWLEPLILFPLLLPALVLAIGYVEAFGPSGVLTTAVNEWAGAVPWNVDSFAFLIAVAGLMHVPYAYLCAAAALRGLGSDGEQAARSAGAGLWRVAFDVTLPLTFPAIALAAALVFLLGLGLFGLPLVLGEGQGVLVLSTYLYKLGNELAAPPLQLMAVVIVIMVCLSLPLVFMGRIIAAARCGALSLDPPGSLRFAPFRLGLWRVPAFLAIAFFIAATVLAPLGALTLRSFTAAWGNDVALAQALTLDHYRALLEHPNVVRSLVNTLGLGLLAAAVAAAFYGAIVLAFHGRRSGWARVVDYLAGALGAVPGLMVGLALLWLLLFFKALTPLHGTLVSLWLAYLIVWLSAGTGIISGALVKVDRQLVDAARTMGATEARTKFDITLPMMRAGLLAGWLLVFLLFARDYSTGIYLLGSGNEVIGPLLVSLWGSGAIDLVSALSVVNVVIIGIGLFVAVRLGARLHA
jgi:iron(III) transport system permease protein